MRPSDEIRILYGDEPHFADLSEKFLRWADDRFEDWSSMTSGKGFIFLAEDQYDCVVGDIDLSLRDVVEWTKRVTNVVARHGVRKTDLRSNHNPWSGRRRRSCSNQTNAGWVELD